MMFYITIEYANLALEDLYAARANGYGAYENNETTFMIEKDYIDENAARADLDGMYGEILTIET